MFLNKSFSVSITPSSGSMTSAGCTFYLPFTLDNVSQLVLTVGYFDNYVNVKVNDTSVYVGRRETTNVDVISKLTTSITKLTIEQSGNTNALNDSVYFSTITTK